MEDSLLKNVAATVTMTSNAHLPVMLMVNGATVLGEIGSEEEYKIWVEKTLKATTPAIPFAKNTGTPEQGGYLHLKNATVILSHMGKPLDLSGGWLRIRFDSIDAHVLGVSQAKNVE
jgi:hypothetical protein